MNLLNLYKSKAAPARQFLFKIASRCNLSCTYCYMYRSADQSWKLKPKIMDRVVVLQSLKRIRDHVIKHNITRLSIIAHGGEPLLVGTDYLHWFFRTCLDVLSDLVVIDFGIQTNCTLINDKFVDIFSQFNVAVGVSIDGDSVSNRYRVYNDGRESYSDVIQGWNTLVKRAPQLSRGILCTINIFADPLVVYHSIAELEPHAIDFLWPLGNYQYPPAGKRFPYDDTPYADWLIPIFDEWYLSRANFYIRQFREIITLLLGGRSKTETWGITDTDLLVIETDGQLEGVDTLKSTYEGAASLGMNVSDHSIDQAMAHPMIQLRLMGRQALSETCQSCSLVEVCGGDYLPHRYHPATGFYTKSIYCSDRMKLVMHVRSRLQEHLRFRKCDA